MESAYFHSPLGAIEITASDSGITSVSFVEKIPEDVFPSSSTLTGCITELQEYFSGTRKSFSVPLDPQGTEFQRSVWKQLELIAFGETRSYLDLALKLGDKNLTRAVGAANGKNPIALIVPCHRVIGEDGSLTGYAGGLWRKEWLLDFESPKRQGSLFPRT